MAVSKKKSKDIESTPTRNYDHNPYWSSSLFNEVYLRNDIPKKYPQWEDDEIGNFYNFYEGIKNLIVEKEADKESFKSWNESDTIRNWIRPIMSLLGWEDPTKPNKNFVIDNASFTIQEDGKTKTYRPDLLYLNDPSHKKHIQDEKNSEDKLREARGKFGAKIILEAKYWGRLEEYRAGKLLDKKRNFGAQQDETSKSLTPEDQTLKYMDILKHDFGILSDGRTWKLFHRDLSNDTTKRCFEFDLGSLIKLDLYKKEDEFKENIKYFYWFFSKEGLLKTNGPLPFAFEVLEYSQKYADNIEEDLKKKFIISMNYLCNGLNESLKKSNKKINLNLLRDVAESHLFNILFIKSCEVRKILPLENTGYYKISLTEIIEALDHMEFDPNKDLDIYIKWLKNQFKNEKFDLDGHEIYNHLMNLYETVQSGRNEKDDFDFGVVGFKESVFSKEEWDIAKKYKIDNKSMLLSLFNLTFTASRIPNRKYQQIPYNYFTPRQLGSIYESFLEFKLDTATNDMIFHNNQWKEANLNSKKVRSLNIVDEHIVEKGELFFSPNNLERKMTGSYYTPEFIVDFIVRETIEPLIKNRSSEEILEIKICDPAMGSGHFLANALIFLTKSYREKKVSEELDDLDESWQRSLEKILNSCIFGNDINPRAVKLAKMNLWLECASQGIDLESLAKHLICADGLLLDLKKDFKGIEKFDCLIMNPPYISELRGNKALFEKYRDNLVTKKYYEAKMNIFYFFICRGLDYLGEGGILGVICEQYWRMRSETKILHRKIFEDSQIKLHVDFRNNIIFPNAPGVHASILILKKSKFPKINVLEEIEMTEKFNTEDGIKNWLNTAPRKQSRLLFSNDDSKFLDKDSIVNNQKFYYLNKDYIQQGLVTPQDNVIPKHQKIEPNLNLGEGIFILKESELNRLDLNKDEQKFIKPFFEANEIERYFNCKSANKFVIYIDSKTNIDLIKKKIKMPNLVTHLNRFKNVITSSNRPYGLHRARQKKWFAKGSKVFSIRKTRGPHFSLVLQEAFVNQAINIIKTNIDFLDKCLCILLNSKKSFEILSKLKTQGSQLQIDKETLLRIPLPLWVNPLKFSEEKMKRNYSDIYKSIIKFFSDEKNFSSEKKVNEAEDIARKLQTIDPKKIMT